QKGVPGFWRAGVAMAAFTGDTDAHQVELRFAPRAFQSVAQVRGVRLLAFVLPPGSGGALEDAQLPIAPVTPSSEASPFVARAVTLPVRPGSPHLWLAHALAHEHPGGDGGAFRFLLDGTVVRSSRESWLVEGDVFHTLFHA